MPKIKINTFGGIYTNIDENDTKLDIFRDSVNFRHEEGYAEFEPRKLSTYDLPDVDSFKGDDPGTWDWETGTYAILVNDRYQTIDPAPAQYRCLFLIAKKQVSSDYHRSFWIKDIDSGSWINLETTSGLDDELFVTDKDGKAKILHDQGVLKVYLPHDHFWIGRLKRTSKEISSYGLFGFPGLFLLDPLLDGVAGDGDPIEYYLSEHDDFYMDRLTDIPSEDNMRDPDNVSADANFRPTTTDPLIRLKVVSHVFPVTAADAPSGLAKKYLMARRRNLYNDVNYFYFWFEKVTQAKTPTGEGINIPISSSNYNNGVYRAEKVAADRIAQCSPIQTQECHSYHLAFHKLPVSIQDYANGGGTGHGENFIDWNPLYYYDSIDKDMFIGPTDWVLSAVLDETTEIVIDKGSLNVEVVDPESPSTSEKYMVRFSFHIPLNINKRVTRFRFYVKQYTYNTTTLEWEPNVDHTLFREMLLLADSTEADNKVDTFGLISKDEDTGVALSQNIGVTYNPATYKIITGFRDYTIDNGIGIGIDYNDYINVYHSTVGGGVLQADLVYRANILELPGVAFVNALASFNNKILILTANTGHVITAEEVAGVLAFSLHDTIENGVKNFDDVAPIQGGVILHTKNGIFISDGFTTNLMSEQINDVVKANYSTGSVKYNSVIHELYYKPTASEDLYRFRFDRSRWERLNATITEDEIKNNVPEAS